MTNDPAFTNYRDHLLGVARWGNVFGDLRDQTDLVDYIDNAAPSLRFADVAELRGFASATRLKAAETLGYHTPYDGGGALYVLIADDSMTADDGIRVIVDASGRRWHFAPQQDIRFEQGGCTDSTTDSGAMMQMVLNACKSLKRDVIQHISLQTGQSLVLPDGVMWTARNGSELRVFGDGTVLPLLDCINGTLDLDGLIFVGNGNTNGQASTVGCWRQVMTADCSKDLPGPRIRNCTYRSFASSILTSVQIIDNPHHDIVGGEIHQNRYFSEANELIWAKSIGGQSADMMLLGYADNPKPPAAGTAIKGVIRGLRVSQFEADGTGRKNFISVFGATQDLKIEHGRIANYGVNAPSQTGRYGIMVYSTRYFSGAVTDERYDPSNIHIDDVVFINSQDCGVYFATARNLSVTNCRFEGQAESDETSLPKGAIAGSGLQGQSNRFANNVINNCQFGIVVSSTRTATCVNLDNNTVAASVSVIAAYKFVGSQQFEADYLVMGRDNEARLQAGGRGIWLLTSPSVAFSRFDWRGGEIEVTTLGFNWTDAGPDATAAEVKLSDVSWRGFWNNAAIAIGATSSRVVLAGTHDFDMTQATGHGVTVINCTNLDVVGTLVFRNKIANPVIFAWNAAGAEGSLSGHLVFKAIRNRERFNTANSLGQVQPTWACSVGDIVRNINYVSRPSAQVMAWRGTSKSGMWVKEKSLIEE